MLPAIALSLFLLAAGPEESSLEEQVRVVVAEIPVQVIRDGKPVRGLTADDFILLDGGKRQKITGFDVRDVTTLVPGRPAADGSSIASRRRFLFLFDFAFSDARALLRAREAARTILAEQLHPTDLAGVATYRPGPGAQLLINFTSDRTQIRAAIDALQMTGERLASDALGLTLVPPDAMAPELGLPAADGGRGSDEAMRIMEVTANRADRRSRQAMVSGMTQGIARFASVLGAVQGRKDVFLFSAGFENSLVFASEDAGRINEMNRSRESGQIWDVDSSERFGDLSQQAGLDRMLESLRQAGCVVHTIDLASLAAGSAEATGASRAKVGGNQGLSLIASETGGRYSRNSNDFDEAIRGVLETTSVTYVLSFQPSVKADGKFRRVKVRLKDAPRGTRVEHRPGYDAPLPFGQRSSGQRLMISAEQLMAEREGGAIPTEVLAVPLRNPTNPRRRFVPLLIEMDGPSLLDQAVADRISLQLFAYVFDGDGRIHGMFTQTVEAAVQAARATLEQTGVKFYGAMSLAPGDYELRILVTGVDTGLTNLRIVPLSVGDANGPELLAPMFPDPLGKWVLARRHASSEDALGFPFLADGAPFLPAAAPSVGREGEGQRLYLLGAELGDVSGLRGRLLAADGTASTLPLAVEGRQRAAVEGYEILITRLDTSGAMPGRYTLRIEGDGLETAPIELTLE